MAAVACVVKGAGALHKKYVARRNVAAARVGATWARMEKRTDRQRKWGADGVGVVQDAEREMGAANHCTAGNNVKRGAGRA